MHSSVLAPAAGTRRFFLPGMVRNFFLLALLCLLLQPGRAQAQRVSFATREYGPAKLAGSAMTATSILRCYIDSRSAMLSNPDYGKYVKYKANTTLVRFGIDHDVNYLPASNVPYVYMLSYKLEGCPSMTDSVYSFSVTDTLVIGYNADSLTAFQDLHVKQYPKLYQSKLTILGLYDMTSGTPVALSLPLSTSYAKNFYVQLAMQYQTYTKKPYSGSELNLTASSTFDAANQLLKVRWDCLGSGLISGVRPAGYRCELEWTYADNYAANGGTLSSVKYDFRHNATRVLVAPDSMGYDIPVVYPKGFIVYRARMIRVDSSRYQTPIIGAWSINETGTASGTSGNWYQVATPHSGDSLNWNYTISFAEGGKYKHVISYFDGMLKNRQTLTRFNTNPLQLLATENIYDYEGRPSITTLPAVIANAPFRYSRGVSTSSVTGLPYGPADFDVKPAVCPDQVVIPPFAATALANKYYSPLNADTAGAQKYVPQAEGYPFVHTMLSPGFSDRVDQQGGAGPLLQVGQGHETTCEYVGADQPDMNQLFGLNAGLGSFYTKTVTKDPNGQYSMLVKDYRGRQMVSSLVGASVDISRHAIVFNDEVPMGARFRENKLANPLVNPVTGKYIKQYNGNFYMDFAAMTTIQYEYAFKPYPVCSSPFLGLSVKGHYEYKLTDACGVQRLYHSGDLGATGVTTVATPPPASATDTLSLEKGKYTLEKTLSLNEADAYAAVDSFMARDPNCLQTENDFIKAAVERTNYPCPAPDPCGELAKSMEEELFTNAKYGKFTRDGPGKVTGVSPSIYDIPQGIPGMPPAAYRYQSPCVIAALDSLVITRYGKTYRNIGELPVDTFMMLYTGDNRYKIAAALLPLHPEYCRLQACFVDTFEAAFRALPDAATAMQNFMFNLPDIIARDKQLTDRMAAFPLSMVNPADSLSRLVGGTRARIDTLSAELAYCDADDDMAYADAHRRYHNDIVTLNFPNGEVRDRYFDKLRTLYLATRAKYNSIARTAGGNHCLPCDSPARMQLVNPPLVTVIYAADGSFATGPGSLLGSMTDSSGLISALLRADAGGAAVDSAWLSRMQDSAKAMVYAADTMSSRVAIDSIMSRLANCYASATARQRLHDSLAVFVSSGAVHNGVFLPEQISSAIRSAGLSLNDLCHPYLVNYDYYIDAGGSRNNCSAPALYDAVRTFLGTPAINTLLSGATGTAVYTAMSSWDNSNLFAAKIATALGTSTALWASSRYSAADSTYYLGFYRYLGTDTLQLTFRSPGIFRVGGSNYGLFQASPGGSVSIDNAACYFEDPTASVAGYIGRFMFRLNVTRKDLSGGVLHTVSAPVHAWNNMLFMNEQGSSDIGNSVPYTQFRDAYRHFADSLTGWGGYAADHPLFFPALRNYMNYNLKKVYTEDQYQRFLQSSALADSMLIPAYGGYCRITFPAVSYSNFDALAAAISASDTVTLTALLDANYTGHQLVVLDYSTIPYHKLALINNKLLAIGAALRSPLSGVAGFLCAPADATLSDITDGTSFSLSLQTDASVKTSYFATTREAYKCYNVTMGTLSNAALSQQLDRLQQNLYSKGIQAYWLPASYATVNTDYYNARKQALLSYVYAMQALPTSKVLDSMQAWYLQTNIPAFGGGDLSYRDPENPDRFTDLNYSDAAFRLPGFDTMSRILNYVTAKRGSSQVLLPTGVRTYPVSGGSVPADASFNVYRCGDGLYWYRYFGAKRQLYNIFIRVPLYIPDGVHPSLQLLGFVPGMGDSTSRSCTVLLRQPGRSDTIRATATTDFDICWSKKLVDVLLGNETEQPAANTPASGEAGAALNCEQLLLANNIYEGKINYVNYITKFRSDLRASFVAFLLDQVQEKLWVDYANMRFGTTLYCYDLAGNLIRSIPPEGVNRLDSAKASMVDSLRGTGVIDANLLPAHKRVTSTDYNSLNRPVREQTPDGGTKSMYYDLKGNVLLSQNAVQGKSGRYTYFLYDKQNRLTETGDVQWGDCPYFDPIPMFAYNGGFRVPINQPDCSDGNYEDSVWEYKKPQLLFYDDSAFNAQVRAKPRKQVVYTVYDVPFMGLDSNRGQSAQTNLRNRIAATMYYDTLAAGMPGRTYDHATHYSYDAAGNISTLTQDFPQLADMRQRFKRVDYDYDLLSGKLNAIAYNRGYGDQFYHRYSYDADNRLEQVETSTDGIIWKRDARYSYYQHGPLARMALGTQTVQGVDYAYTLQGWLKAINGDRNDTLVDMGGDGKWSVSVVPSDRYATVLDYFAGDYKPIGNRPVSRVPAQDKQLYNGNIARVSNDVKPFDALTTAYTYDQMNRIRSARYAPTTATALAFNSNYASDYKYDQDGNLKQLTRREGSGMLLDSLVYVYPNGTVNNKLGSVLEYASLSLAGAGDLQLYTGAATRLMYNENGEVTKDLTSNTDSIRWNIYGKSTDIVSTTTGLNLHFGYDAQGRRTYKTRTVYSTRVGELTKIFRTYYVREAGGNILAEYTQENDSVVGSILTGGGTGTVLRLRTLSLAAHHVYGSSRLGIANYWPQQYRHMTDLYNGVYDTLSPVQGRPWYSSEMNELIRADSQNVYGNSLLTASAAQFLVGQRQYELTNHLGNVQVALSDKRTSKRLASLYYFIPGITAAYDYYPYGQLMPGRFVSDTTPQCATVTLTRSLPYARTAYIAPTSGVGSGGATVTANITYGCNSLKQAAITGQTGVVTYSLPVSPNMPMQLYVSVPIMNNGDLIVSVTEVRTSGVTTLYSQRISTSGITYPKEVNTSLTPTQSTLSLAISSTQSKVTSTTLFSVACISYDKWEVTRDNSIVQICSSGQDKYPMGYNGQLKMNEIAGTGNWNTAEFWEYQTRTGHRENTDPVKNASYSPYAAFGGNPILYADVKGDVWKTKADEKYAAHISNRLENRSNDLLDGANKLIAQADKQEAKGHAKKANDLRQSADRLKKGAEELMKGKSEIDKMTTDPTVFTFKAHDDEVSRTYMDKDGVVIVEYGTDANAVHELTHAYQQLTGEVEMIPGTTRANYVDAIDESNAYTRQFYFDPESVIKLPTSPIVNIKTANDVSPDFVLRIITIDPHGNPVPVYGGRIGKNEEHKTATVESKETK